MWVIYKVHNEKCSYTDKEKDLQYRSKEGRQKAFNLKAHFS